MGVYRDTVRVKGSASGRSRHGGDSRAGSVHEDAAPEWTRTGQGRATMSDEVKFEEWWITGQAEKRGPYQDRETACAVARSLKQINPGRHLAVENPNGHSEAVD
jgi:hypothetical protein